MSPSALFCSAFSDKSVIVAKYFCFVLQCIFMSYDNDTLLQCAQQ